MFDNQYLSRLTSDLLQIFIRDQPLTSFNALLKLRISSRVLERFHFDVETHVQFYPQSTTNPYLYTNAYKATRTIWSGHPPQTFDQVTRLNLQRTVKKNNNTPHVKTTCETCSFL